MKRIVFATAGVAVIAFAAATLGSAQTTATTATAREAAKAPALPRLPAEIANRKRLIVGVKCDTPPFGYLDVRGKNAGVDVEIAKQFARYAFGRAQRLTFALEDGAASVELAARAAPGRPSRLAFVSPPGTAGFSVANYDFNDPSVGTNNADWPVDLIFTGRASVAKVKAGLTSLEEVLRVTA